MEHAVELRLHLDAALDRYATGVVAFRAGIITRQQLERRQQEAQSAWDGLNGFLSRQWEVNWAWTREVPPR